MSKMASGRAIVVSEPIRNACRASRFIFGLAAYASMFSRTRTSHRTRRGLDAFRRVRVLKVSRASDRLVSTAWFNTARSWLRLSSIAAGLRTFSIVTSPLLFRQRTGCVRAHIRYFSAKTLVVAASQLVADSPFSARYSRITFILERRCASGSCFDDLGEDRHGRIAHRSQFPDDALQPICAVGNAQRLEK